MSDVKTRPYRSSRRQAQAADTRRRILAAAAELFVERGFQQTTIADIAAASDTATQTVYATFGSKAGLLIALLDARTEQVGLSEARAAVAAAAGDARRQLGIYVHFDRRLFEEAREIIEVGLGSRRVDPDVGAWFAEGERRRRVNQRPLVDAWHRSGALRSGLGSKRAADILWALTGPAVYSVFVREAGWTPAAFERWLRSTLEDQLFG